MLASRQNDSSYDHAVFTEDSPMTNFLIVNFTAKFQTAKGARAPNERVSDRKNIGQLLANKSPYLRNGAR